MLSNYLAVDGGKNLVTLLKEILKRGILSDIWWFIEKSIKCKNKIQYIEYILFIERTYFYVRVKGRRHFTLNKLLNWKARNLGQKVPNNKTRTMGLEKVDHNFIMWWSTKVPIQLTCRLHVHMPYCIESEEISEQ